MLQTGSHAYSRRGGSGKGRLGTVHRSSLGSSTRLLSNTRLLMGF